MYIGRLIEDILNVFLYDTRFPHRLIAQQDDLQLRLATHRAH